MFEGLTPSDDFAETGEFETVHQVAPCKRVPVSTASGVLELTPANAVVRAFVDPELGIFDPSHEDYNRVIVKLEDGSTVPFRPETDLLRSMIKGGFPVELPKQPDASDQEFIDSYMRFWTEQVNSELGLS